MTFDEVLEQVLALLQREGRVSYRALKRRFELDDEYLEDVKAEIIDAKELAIDKDGKVLVWTGRQDREQSGQPGSAPKPQAERRQLTVMFCDLVGSTMKPISREWVNKAEEDYRVARREREAKPAAYSAVCFHAQQCVEKYLKAFLQEQDIPFYRTHDLEALMKLCEPMVPDLEKHQDQLHLMWRWTRFSSCCPQGAGGVPIALADLQLAHRRL